MSLNATRVPGTESYIPGLNIGLWDLTFDSSYPTGGEVLSPAAVGAGGGGIRGVMVVGCDAEAAPYHVVWNKDTGKLMVFRSGAASVTGNVTVVGGAVGEAIGINPDSNAGVLSKAAATNRTIPIATFLGAAPAVAAAALAEVSSTTDLSTLTVRVMVISS